MITLYGTAHSSRWQMFSSPIPWTGRDRHNGRCTTRRWKIIATV